MCDKELNMKDESSQCSECQTIVHAKCDQNQPAAANYMCPLCRYDKDEQLAASIQAQIDQDSNREAEKIADDLATLAKSPPLSIGHGKLSPTPSPANTSRPGHILRHVWKYLILIKFPAHQYNNTSALSLQASGPVLL